MNIIVTDWLFPDLAVEQSIVEKAGRKLVAGQCKTEAELIALVADADAVITQFARIVGAAHGFCILPCRVGGKRRDERQSQ